MTIPTQPLLASYKASVAQPTTRPNLAVGLQGSSQSSAANVTTNSGSVTADHYCLLLVHTTRNGGAPDSVSGTPSDSRGTSYTQLAVLQNTAVSTAQHRVEIWGGKIPSTGTNAVTVAFSGGNGAHLVQAMTFSAVNTTSPFAGTITSSQNDGSGSVAPSLTASSIYDNSLAVVVSADIGNFANVNGTGWTLWSNVQTGSPQASSSWWRKNLDSSASVAISGDAFPNWIYVSIPLKGT